MDLVWLISIPAKVCGASMTYILERVNSLGSLLDFASDNLRNQLVSELCKGTAGSLSLNDICHFATDSTNLRGGSVCRLLNLVGSTLGECDGEEANQVIVGSLDRDIRLNETLPLSHERSKLVGSEVEPIETSQAVLALDLIDAEADFAE